MRKRILAMALSICMAVVVCGCGNAKTKQAETESNATESASDISEDYDGMVEDSMIASDECNAMPTADDYCEEPIDWNTNEYSYTEENPWMNVQTSPLSTFAADVDTASYTQIRSAIENGYDIDPSMVRIEEMLNYFHYDYPLPKDN